MMTFSFKNIYLDEAFPNFELPFGGITGGQCHDRNDVIRHVRGALTVANISLSYGWPWPRTITV